MRSGLHRFRTSILALMLMFASALFAQSPRTYHIELLLGFWQHLSPLDDKNFSVTQAGKVIPFHLTHLSDGKSNLPPHLLVVFPEAALRPADAAIQKKLSAFLKAGWQIGITRSDGSFTPWCASAKELSNALAAHSHVSSAPANRLQAIHQLDRFPGRRAVLYASRPSPEDAQELKQLGHILREVYVVDGGRPEKQTITMDPIDRQGISHPGPLSVDSQIDVHRPYYDDGVWHEISLRKALADCLADSHAYYDLTLTPVVNALRDDLPFELTLSSRNMDSVTVQIYAVDQSNPDAPVRQIPTPQLHVVWSSSSTAER